MEPEQWIIILVVFAILYKCKESFNMNDQVVKRERIEPFMQSGLLGAEHQTAVTKTRNISQDIRSTPR